LTSATSSNTENSVISPIKAIIKRSPTSNERIGASWAVAHSRGSEDFQVLCLISSAVKAPPAIKPPSVTCHWRTPHQQWKLEI